MDSKKFEQIAYAMRPMILACLEAYDITGKEQYAVQAVELSKWFFGNNPAKVRMYYPETGIVFDGIDGVDSYNKNSGAESTIECLMALQAIESNPVTSEKLHAYLKAMKLE